MPSYRSPSLPDQPFSRSASSSFAEVIVESERAAIERFASALVAKHDLTGEDPAGATATAGFRLTGATAAAREPAEVGHGTTNGVAY